MPFASFLFPLYIVVIALILPFAHCMATQRDTPRFLAFTRQHIQSSIFFFGSTRILPSLNQSLPELYAGMPAWPRQEIANVGVARLGERGIITPAFPTSPSGHAF